MREFSSQFLVEIDCIVHNAKAEECTTPRIGSRNIEINIGGGGLPRNQK